MAFIVSKRLNKKFILVSGAFLSFIVVVLSCMGLYLYYHPERIKSMMEMSLSAATGSSCTIQNLTFSLLPMVIEAGGVVFKTPGPQAAFSIELPFVRVDFALGGSWGHRSLILENLQVNGISVNLNLPAILPGEKESSFTTGTVRNLVRIFLFRDIIFQSGEILDGHISASWEKQTIQAHQIHAKAGTGKTLSLSFAMEAKNASRNMHYTAPKVNIVSANVLDMNDLKFSGTLHAEDMKLQDVGLGIRKMEVQSKFTYRHAQKNLQVENLELDIRDLALKGTQEGLPLMDVSLHAAAAIQVFPSDLDLSARDTIWVEVAGPEAGLWQVKTKLSVKDLVFKNKAGSMMGENISFTTETEGTVDLKNASMTFTSALEAKTGEALYDRYYLNLLKNPIVASCNGTYQFQQRFLQLFKFRFDLKDILPLEIKGVLKRGPERDADFAVNIQQVSLKPIFNHLLLEPYKTEMPLLATLETGGTVSAEFKVKEFENARQVTGQIKWRQGNLVFPDRGISLKDIHLDLPVWYQTGLADAPVDGLKGKFEVQSVTVPPLPEQPLSILLVSGPNKISIDLPTVIQVPGGDLRLGSVQAKNIFGPDISVHTCLEFDEIKLQPLLSGIVTIPPESTLTGMLDSVRYENHAVTSQGEIATKVFGGKIILSNMGASGLLTAAPVFKLNAHWDDLKLTEMTTDTAFGKIEGVLKGHIRDFEIAYGQPQKFVLLLETVNTKGVPQTISIRAIDNIAQLGGGQSPFMGLAGAFASVFKKFPYEKIGMRARLENDMFTINGTIREDGTEYLVKRRGFSGVNIVNQNPDNRISLKDMMKRIKRITQGEAVVE